MSCYTPKCKNLNEGWCYGPNSYDRDHQCTACYIDGTLAAILKQAYSSAIRIPIPPPPRTKVAMGSLAPSIGGSAVAPAQAKEPGEILQNMLIDEYIKTSAWGPQPYGWAHSPAQIKEAWNNLAAKVKVIGVDSASNGSPDSLEEQVLALDKDKQLKLYKLLWANGNRI